MAAGAPPKGLEQAFAATLQISPSMWSQIKASRPIGDKLARQIEKLCGKPVGWLDQVRAVQAVTPVEQAFLDLALTAWRATNSVGKKQMRAQLSHILQPVPGAVSGALNRLASPKPIRARSNGG